MDFKDFIIGEKYNISALAIEGSFAAKKYAVFKLPTGRTFLLRSEDFEAVSPARQDVRSEHSTVGTLNSVERWEKLWNGMHDVLFANGTKNTETAPKYDPFRRFRKGDRVSPCAWQDRAPTARMGACCIIPKFGTYEVLTDELHEMVSLRYGEDTIKMHICFLELVTPVEELEPYFIEESHDGATIVLTVRCIPNGEGIAFRYCPGWGGNVFHSEEQFRQHAVAERDRLNAEHRKEKE